MESRSRQPFVRRLLPGVLAASCVVGSLFGLLNGYYLLAFSQVAFATAMISIFFGAETRGNVYQHLT